MKLMAVTKFIMVTAVILLWFSCQVTTKPVVMPTTTKPVVTPEPDIKVATQKTETASSGQDPAAPIKADSITKGYQDQIDNIIKTELLKQAAPIKADSITKGYQDQIDNIIKTELLKQAAPIKADSITKGYQDQIDNIIKTELLKQAEPIKAGSIAKLTVCGITLGDQIQSLPKAELLKQDGKTFVYEVKNVLSGQKDILAVTANSNGVILGAMFIFRGEGASDQMVQILREHMLFKRLKNTSEGLWEGDVGKGYDAKIDKGEDGADILFNFRENRLGGK
jgi:hypothetical protein